jgi:glyoxylase-like metal-dependent hydrolase (beta-lactamase superfamily II)
MIMRPSDQRPMLPARPLHRRAVLRTAAGAAVAAGAARVALPAAAAQSTPAATPVAVAPYRFEVGAFSITAVSDGSLTFPNPAFPIPASQIYFADAPADQLADALVESGRADWLDDPENAGDSAAITPLVVDTGAKLVLLDTGVGSGFFPGTGLLMASLEAASIAPGDIDTVFFTHGHADHVLGAVDAAGGPAFPNARFAMAAGEHAFWTSDERLTQVFGSVEAGLEAGGAFRAVLPAIQDRLDLVNEAAGDEIVPGLRALAAYGHTPGHAAVLVESEGEQLLVIGDALIHPLHVQYPDWNFIADTLFSQTDTTRRGLLDRAATDGMLVHVYHVPFPGLGRVSRGAKGFVWAPAG